MAVTDPTNIPAPPVEEVTEEGSEQVVGSFNDAKGENKKEGPAPQEEPQDILDTIVPRAEPRVWEIGPADMQRTFIQKPMSFIAKMQWFSLIGEALDKALGGPDGMSLNGLFSAPDRVGALRPEDLRNADTFVQAISKLMAAAPDFLVKSFCIWLSVPDYERDIVIDLMKLPADEGGLSDEQGIEIIEVFLDQNYEALASFFGERLGQLQARVAKLNMTRSEREESRRSKR